MKILYKILVFNRNHGKSMKKYHQKYRDSGYWLEVRHPGAIET